MGTNSCIYIDEAGLCQHDKIMGNHPRNSPLRKCLVLCGSGKCVHQTENNAPLCQKCFDNVAAVQVDDDYLCTECYINND